MVEIYKGIKITDLALYIEKEQILVIADLHIGYEEALNEQGILVPRFQFEETLKRLNKIIKIVTPEKIKKVIINGDLKHEFGTISQQEWRNTLKLIDFLNEKIIKDDKSKEIILVKGNHDTIIEPITNKKNIKVLDFFNIKNISILHGHELIKKQAILNSDALIIAHEHPAISFSERRDEKFKCFLQGKYKDKILIVMPSMNQVTAGTDITKEMLLSPYLQQDLNNFNVYLIEDKVYKFGRLRDIP